MSKKQIVGVKEFTPESGKGRLFRVEFSDGSTEVTAYDPTAKKQDQAELVRQSVKQAQMSGRVNLPSAEDRKIADRVNKDDKMRKVIQEQAQAEAAGELASSLLGSSVQPSLVKIGEVEVPLGEIVALAQTESGLTVEEWNDLDEADREMLLEVAIEGMREQAPGAKADAGEELDTKTEKEGPATGEPRTEVTGTILDD